MYTVSLVEYSGDEIVNAKIIGQVEEVESGLDVGRAAANSYPLAEGNDLEGVVFLTSDYSMTPIESAWIL